MIDERDTKTKLKKEKRRKRELILKCMISLLLLVIIVLCVILMKDAAIPEIKNHLTGKKEKTQQSGKENTVSFLDQLTGEDQNGAGGAAEELLSKAEHLAAQYDYDGAARFLEEQPEYAVSQEMQDAAAGYRRMDESCSAYPLDQITHIFFHTMIWDTDKAFDGDSKEGGYNQVMTTMDEFTAIMETLYAKGYVMVSIHDMCEIAEDGTVSRKEIRLPAGKTPFVLSQDDVSYYHYMDGDGFARRLVLDENGEVKNEYVEEDGSISVGDYDMVPWIDSFVKEHPDFSYHGHKGILALTGYEGVLGYRTDEVYRTREAGRVTDYQQAFFDANPDFDEKAWQKEVEDARAVAEAMKENGWEFASHTWGHISPLASGLENTRKDTQRWKENVASVVGDTDVIIFAFGADIGGWEPYTQENELFRYLSSQGFRIFCNVDSSRYWVQFGNDYLRQGRRNLDGYRMYYQPELMEDLFDVDSVWDTSRPTPVPPMG